METIGQLHSTAVLPQKSNPVPNECETVSSGGGLDIFWEDKYLLPLAWFEPWIIQVVA